MYKSNILLISFAPSLHHCVHIDWYHGNEEIVEYVIFFLDLPWNMFSDLALASKFIQLENHALLLFRDPPPPFQTKKKREGKDNSMYLHGNEAKHAIYFFSQIMKMTFQMTFQNYNLVLNLIFFIYVSSKRETDRK